MAEEQVKDATELSPIEPANIDPITTITHPVVISETILPGPVNPNPRDDTLVPDSGEYSGDTHI